MVNKLRRLFKNEKGFTLVELLAVIVIMGIIAAIAVPSIAGIINNTRDDAHDANAVQMIETARLAYITGVPTESLDNVDDDGYKLSTLVNEGFLESVPDNPEKNQSYNARFSFVEVDDSGTGPVEYKVTLAKNSNTSHNYITSKSLSHFQD